MAWKEGISYLPGTWRMKQAGKRGQGIKITGAEEVDLTVANDHPDGILVQDHKKGDLVRAVSLHAGQVAEIKLAAAISAGGKIRCGAGGDFIAADDGTAATIIGSISEAGADNDLAPCYLNPYRHHV